MSNDRGDCVATSGRLAWLFGLLGIAVLLGCNPPEPIRLGFVGGASGRVADLGIAGRDAVLLAVEQRNREGGVAGRQIQLLIRDDGIGFPPTVDFRRTPSLGLTIVMTLVKQLKGDIALRTPAGTEFVIAFPDPARPGPRSNA